MLPLHDVSNDVGDDDHDDMCCSNVNAAGKQPSGFTHTGRLVAAQPLVD